MYGSLKLPLSQNWRERVSSVTRAQNNFWILLLLSTLVASFLRDNGDISFVLGVGVIALKSTEPIPSIPHRYWTLVAYSKDFFKIWNFFSMPLLQIDIQHWVQGVKVILHFQVLTIHQVHFLLSPFPILAWFSRLPLGPPECGVKKNIAVYCWIINCNFGLRITIITPS